MFFGFFFIVGEGGLQEPGVGRWGRTRKADGVVVFARTRKMLDYGKECRHALKRIHGVERRWLQDCGRLWILRVDRNVLVDVSDIGTGAGCYVVRVRTWPGRFLA